MLKKLSELQKEINNSDEILGVRLQNIYGSEQFYVHIDSVEGLAKFCGSEQFKVVIRDGYDFPYELQSVKDDVVAYCILTEEEFKKVEESDKWSIQQ